MAQFQHKLRAKVEIGWKNCQKMSPTLPAQNPHVLQIREEDGHTNIWGQTEALWGRKSDLQDFVFSAWCASSLQFEVFLGPTMLERDRFLLLMIFPVFFAAKDCNSIQVWEAFGRSGLLGKLEFLWCGKFVSC